MCYVCSSLTVTIFNIVRTLAILRSTEASPYKLWPSTLVWCQPWAVFLRHATVANYCLLKFCKQKFCNQKYFPKLGFTENIATILFFLWWQIYLTKRTHGNAYPKWIKFSVVKFSWIKTKLYNILLEVGMEYCSAYFDKCFES